MKLRGKNIHYRLQKILFQYFKLLNKLKHKPFKNAHFLFQKLKYQKTPIKL